MSRISARIRPPIGKTISLRGRGFHSSDVILTDAASRRALVEITASSRDKNTTSEAARIIASVFFPLGAFPREACMLGRIEDIRAEKTRACARVIREAKE